MRKSVIIVSWNGENEVGGVEMVTYYMHRAWEKEYDVVIIDLDMVKKNTVFRHIMGLHFSIDAWIVSFYVNHYVKKLKKQKGEDNVFVITQGYNAPGVAADIAFAHGTMRGYKISVYGNYTWHLNQLYERHSWFKAKRVIAVGNHVKQEACSLYGISSDKIEVISNCINTDIFFPACRENNGICTIIFSGRLETGKGIDKLRRLAEIIEHDSRFYLIIATPFSKNASVFQTFSKTKVRVGLKKNEMNQFYNSGNVMYFPSLYEGFELVTVECLAAGVPVAGNMVGAVKDLTELGMPGINILSGNINEDLEMMYLIAMEYNEMPKRKQLHEKIEDYLNYDLYEEKLKTILRSMGNDER